MEVLLSFHVKNVGVEGLSKISLSNDDRLQSFQNLLNKIDAREGFYLATCNRVEFLFVVDNESALNSFDFKGLEPRIYTDRADILKHLLEVTLSKDSVVFGESQILGQFKRAYEQCLIYKTVGPELSPFLNAIIRDAKAIRTRVGLTQCHTSISTIAGHKILSSNKPQRILFVGAGETNTILARYLSKRTKSELVWMSRTQERSESAVHQCGGTTLDWSYLGTSEMPQADVICVATHSKEILVDKKVLEAVRPKLVCDLAVPPNASHEDCAEMAITYYGIDELNEELSKSQTVSKSMIDRLEDEIAESVARILDQLHVRASRSLFAATIASSEVLLKNELENLFKIEPNLVGKDRENITKWSRLLVKKLNHAHFEALKSALLEEEKNESIESGNARQ